MLDTLPPGVARQIPIQLTPRSLEWPVWVLDTGLWVCGCWEAFKFRGKPDCAHVRAAKEVKE